MPTLTTAPKYQNDTDELTRLIKTHAHGGNFEVVERLVSALHASGAEVSSEINTLILHACARAGDADRAAKRLSDMEHLGFMPTEATYNVILNAFAAQGDPTKMVNWVNIMVRKGLTANTVTFGTMCKVYARIGKPDLIWRIMSLCDRNGVQVNEYFHAALISAYGRQTHPNLRGAEMALMDMLKRGLNPASIRRVLTKVIGHARVAHILRSTKSAPYAFFSQWTSERARRSKGTADKQQCSESGSAILGDENTPHGQDGAQRHPPPNFQRDPAHEKLRSGSDLSNSEAMVQELFAINMEATDYDQVEVTLPPSRNRFVQEASRTNHIQNRTTANCHSAVPDGNGCRKVGDQDSQTKHIQNRTAANCHSAVPDATYCQKVGDQGYKLGAVKVLAHNCPAEEMAQKDHKLGMIAPPTSNCFAPEAQKDHKLGMIAPPTTSCFAPEALKDHKLGMIASPTSNCFAPEAYGATKIYLDCTPEGSLRTGQFSWPQADHALAFATPHYAQEICVDDAKNNYIFPGMVLCL